MKNNIIAIDTSKEYILHVDKFLERSKLTILEWFEESFSDFKVNTFIYKDNKALREGLKRRGLGLYPAHMVACMVDEDPLQGIRRSINFYEPPTISKDSYNKKEYDQVIFHELIHYITNMIFGKLPEWVTEGLAKYLDGSYQEDLSNLIINHVCTYEIPSISDMKNDFFVVKRYEKEITEADEELKEVVVYDGYDLSYLMIRYIIEVYGKDHLFSLLRNKEQIKEQEQTILIEAIEYYKKLYFTENTIKNLKI